VRNLFQYSIVIFYDFIVPEAQNSVTLGDEEISSTLISIHVFSVMTAIKLDHQASFVAAEVGNNPPIGYWRRNLAPESWRARSRDHNLPSTWV
jgi:hypothetical protein